MSIYGLTVDELSSLQQFGVGSAASAQALVLDQRMNWLDGMMMHDHRPAVYILFVWLLLCSFFG